MTFSRRTVLKAGAASGSAIAYAPPFFLDPRAAATWVARRPEENA